MTLLGSVRVRTLRSPGRAGQVTAGVLAATAWALLAGGYAAGWQHLLSHDAILEHGELALPVAALAFAAAWQVMIGAMMLPTALPAVGAFSKQDRRPEARMGLAAFLGAYFAVWTAFGIVALGADAGLHAIADAWGWLGDRPPLVAASVLLLAAVYQFLPVKRRCLTECRDPATPTAGCGHGETAWRAGIRHGIACLGTNWALMLAMFAVGLHTLWWIALLTLVMAAEKMLPGRRRIVPATGAALGIAGVLVALA